MDLAGKLVVISPHFDDAVFSCGDWLAARPGGTVLTVYSAVPHSSTPLPDRDRRCGFARADQAMLARHAENRAAMEVLGARGLGLGLLDDQYGAPGTDAGRLTGALASALTTLQPDVVLVPLGLFHHDNLRASDAALVVWRLFRETLGCTWLAYEDAPYRPAPGPVLQRLAELRARHISLTPLVGPQYRGSRKIRAAAAYASHRGAPRPGDAAAPERYWHLEAEESAG